MKPEPLRGKKGDLATIVEKEMGIHIIGFHEKCVKSAVEFYKKYKFDIFANPNCIQGIGLLREDYPNIAKGWDETKHGWVNYNDWLFDYTFSDVIDE